MPPRVPMRPTHGAGRLAQSDWAVARPSCACDPTTAARRHTRRTRAPLITIITIVTPPMYI
eukprot:scaffold2631_cov412-Prasinococcus_capsulatus_cf.AAC.2